VPTRFALFAACVCWLGRGPLRRALRRGGFVAVNAIGRREQLAEYGARLKKCGFWPIYSFLIDPNVTQT
jgi:hypothetical protein